MSLLKQASCLRSYGVEAREYLEAQKGHIGYWRINQSNQSNQSSCMALLLCNTLCTISAWCLALHIDFGGSSVID
jgi:hypothetical protein